MTGEGVPRIAPAPLDCTDEAPVPYGIVQALEHAYYQRDVEAMRRIGQQAEQNMEAMRKRIAELTRAGPA